MQQGRVQLDADWNEQTSILLHYMRALGRDLFGPHAGPAAGAGFEIIGSMTKDWEAKLKAMLDQKQIGRDRYDALGKAVKAGNLVITRGRYYVGGVPAANDAAALYTEQLGCPRAEMKDADRVALWKANVVFYLDVWERHVTWLDDGHIREVALGGPDTCTRAQVYWQVRSLLPDGGAKIDCSAVDNIVRGTGTLRAMAHGKPSDELCAISPEATYRGAENQLYRVEIHEGGTTDKATYKWSRENGSVVFPVVSLSASGATLGHAGHDRRSGLKDGDWVEVVDDVGASGNAPGILARVKGPPQHLVVALDFAGDFASYGYKDFQNRLAMLRRWDHVGDVKANGAIPIGKAVDTEKGWAARETTGSSPRAPPPAVSTGRANARTAARIRTTNRSARPCRRMAHCITTRRSRPGTESSGTTAARFWPRCRTPSAGRPRNVALANN
nr:DUF6519 domain-containing protein [Bradyrhizobium sp. 2S1]